MFNTFLKFACAAGLAANAPVALCADPWPSNPLKLAVTFAAGGATDVTARLIAEKIRVDLGRPVLVDNRPGAGGNIGADIVAKAPADGYTLLMVTSSPLSPLAS